MTKKKPLEDRIMGVVFRVVVIWFIQFSKRLLPIMILVLLIGLFFPEKIFTLWSISLLGAGLWAVADLARGNEIDQEFKEGETLRAQFDQWRENR